MLHLSGQHPLKFNVFDCKFALFCLSTTSKHVPHAHRNCCRSLIFHIHTYTLCSWTAYQEKVLRTILRHGAQVVGPSVEVSSPSLGLLLRQSNVGRLFLQSLQSKHNTSWHCSTCGCAHQQQQKKTHYMRSWSNKKHKISFSSQKDCFPNSNTY